MSYAGQSAGVLFVAAAAGMLAGDTLVGRWTTARRRRRLANSLYGLLAAPYLAFLGRPGAIEAAGLVIATGIRSLARHGVSADRPGLAETAGQQVIAASARAEERPHCGWP